MRQRVPWFEISLVGLLMIGMLAVMWAERAPAGCALSFEAPRPLVLSRDIDREHLAGDLAAAKRAARRLTSLAGSAHDAPVVACEAALVREIATRHAVSAEQVRAAATALP